MGEAGNPCGTGSVGNRAGRKGLGDGMEMGFRRDFRGRRSVRASPGAEPRLDLVRFLVDGSGVILSGARG